MVADLGRSSCASRVPSAPTPFSAFGEERGGACVRATAAEALGVRARS